MEKSTVAKNVFKATRMPARNAHLMESLRVATSTLVEEILDIDFLLLNCKRELARAQPRTHGGISVNFSASQEIRGGLDVEPMVVRFFRDSDGKWIVRELQYTHGKLHLLRAFGKGGVPFEQDGIVAALLKEIDKLLQMRDELILLTRPLRQRGNGLVKKAQKTRRKGSEKLDKLSPKIMIDWSNPDNSALDDVAKRQALREERKLRRIAKQPMSI